MKKKLKKLAEYEAKEKREEEEKRLDEEAKRRYEEEKKKKAKAKKIEVVKVQGAAAGEKRKAPTDEKRADEDDKKKQKPLEIDLEAGEKKEKVRNMMIANIASDLGLGFKTIASLATQAIYRFEEVDPELLELYLYRY